ncbi:unnamed protein product, partial [Angiostrongylus costaricensis]|uniref:Uncharacterized protein n=1 Tax=Angiostrongylus costaricensis TaxID=334426 RepID=A0A0R3PY55_ANGCS
MEHNVSAKYALVGMCIELKCSESLVLVSLRFVQNFSKRHKCPHDRNASSFSLGDDYSSGQFPDSLKAAVIGPYAPTSTNINDIDKNLSNETKSRYIERMALKQRNQSSQDSSPRKALVGNKISRPEVYRNRSEIEDNAPKRDVAEQMIMHHKNNVIDYNTNDKNDSGIKDISPSRKKRQLSHMGIIFQDDSDRNQILEIKPTKVSEILNRNGSFTGSLTLKQQHFSKEEHYETKQPSDCSIFNNNGSLTDKTVKQQEYALRKGEWNETKRPKDSEILIGDGSFTDKTMNQQDYVVNK